MLIDDKPLFLVDQVHHQRYSKIDEFSGFSGWGLVLQEKENDMFGERMNYYQNHLSFRGSQVVRNRKEYVLVESMEFGQESITEVDFQNVKSIKVGKSVFTPSQVDFIGHQLENFFGGYNKLYWNFQYFVVCLINILTLGEFGDQVEALKTVENFLGNRTPMFTLSSSPVGRQLNQYLVIRDKNNFLDRGSYANESKQDLEKLKKEIECKHKSGDHHFANLNIEKLSEVVLYV